MATDKGNGRERGQVSWLQTRLQDQVSICLFFSCILSHAHLALPGASYGACPDIPIQQVFSKSLLYVWPSWDDEWTTDPYLREHEVS